MIDYEKICDEILRIDKKIRFAGIFDSPSAYGKMQEGLKSYLTEFETESSLNQSLSRYKARLRFEQKIGKPVFSMTKYEKVYRITIPFMDESIICFSTELDVNIIQIIENVEKIRDNNVS